MESGKKAIRTILIKSHILNTVGAACSADWCSKKLTKTIPFGKLGGSSTAGFHCECIENQQRCFGRN